MLLVRLLRRRCQDGIEWYELDKARSIRADAERIASEKHDALSALRSAASTITTSRYERQCSDAKDVLQSSSDSAHGVLDSTEDEVHDNAIRQTLADAIDAGNALLGWERLMTRHKRSATIMLNGSRRRKKRQSGNDRLRLRLLLQQGSRLLLRRLRVQRPPQVAGMLPSPRMRHGIYPIVVTIKRELQMRMVPSASTARAVSSRTGAVRTARSSQRNRAASLWMVSPTITCARL